MATRAYEGIAKNIEGEIIEKLAGDAEILLDEEDSKKDHKESRKITKERSYSGSYKLKHMIPKGKHL
jgi:hypothetical protein